jgi:hypothetical protein
MYDMYLSVFVAQWVTSTVQYSNCSRLRLINVKLNKVSVSLEIQASFLTR